MGISRCRAIAALLLGVAAGVAQPQSSGIDVHALTNNQIENLAILGKVWGFLKYHHPDATTGKKNWDHELFEVMLSVLDATGRQAADAAILGWIGTLSPVEACRPCVSPPHEPQLATDIKWLNDQDLLGTKLSNVLLRIYANRMPGRQWYVRLAPPGIPEFTHETDYANMQTDFGLQVLAVYRFWNAIEYWYPYRNLIPSDWDAVLRKYIAAAGLANSLREYQRSILRLAALIQDSHEFVSAPLALAPPEGVCMLPVALRSIANDAVVTDVFGDGDIERGDIIRQIDGVAVARMIEELRLWYGESNEAARLRDIIAGLTRGECGGDVGLEVERDGQIRVVRMRRVTTASIRGRWINSVENHGLPGPAVRRLTADIGYINITARAAEIEPFIASIQDTKGLIVDLRGVPRESLIVELLSSLFNRPTTWAKATTADLSNPGAFLWSEQPPLFPGNGPHYSGKLAILVDERTQSHTEYIAMALHTVPGSVVVGSTTAGADGNVIWVPLPGNVRVQITGAGIFYPDGGPTQQIGIVPDVRVVPTPAGIRQQRDEVVEAAERLLAGK